MRVFNTNKPILICVLFLSFTIHLFCQNPFLSNPDTTNLTFNEGDPAIVIIPQALIADTSSSYIISATASIAGGFNHLQDILSLSAQPFITSIYNSTTGVLDMSGTATIADYQSALRAVKYSNSNVFNPDTALRTITFQIIDSSNSASNTILRNIKIISTDEPPVLSHNEPAALNYNEGDGAVNITSKLQVNDPDNTDLVSATISISPGYIKGEDFLEFPTGTLTSAFDTVTGVLHLTGISSLDQYQTALRSITYSNISQNPTEITRTIVFTVNDGVLNSAPVNRNINIHAVNTAPSLSGIESSILSYTEGDGSKIISSTLQVADPDNTSLSSATVSITSGYIPGEDTLFVTGALSGVFNAGMLTISGPATIADFQSTLNQVKYQDLNIYNPSTGTDRKISFQVNDGQLNSNSPFRYIHLTAINQKPVLDNIEGTALQFNEDTQAQFITQSIEVKDVDNLNITSATIQIDQNFTNTEDSLKYQIIPGITPTYNFTLGRITGTGSATLAAYQAFIRSIKYKNFNTLNPSTLTRRVSFTVNDGTASSDLVYRSINIIPHNDPPIASGASISGATILHVHDFLIGQYTYTDPESNPQGNSIINWYTASNSNGANRAVISGAVKDTFTIQFPEGGKYISFIVRPFDNQNMEGTADTSAWKYINAAPEFLNFTLKNISNPGSVAVGETVSADFTYSDFENDTEGTHLYTWYSATQSDGSDGVSINGAVSKQYVIPASMLNKYISVRAIPVALTGSTPGNLYSSTWFKVSSSPSAVISGSDTICNNGSNGTLIVSLSGGTAPWSFTYRRNNGTPVSITNVQVENSTYHLQVSDSGTYTLVSVHDHNNVNGDVAGSGKITYYRNPTATLTMSSLSICDNDNSIYNLPFNLTGKAPWSITYHVNGLTGGTISNITSTTSSIPVTYAGIGTYTIATVTDANCQSTGTGSTAVITKTNPRATISGNATVCPGDTANLNVALTGNGPWTFYFSHDNGNEVSVSVNQNLSTYNYIYKSNNPGSYILTRVTDQTQDGCVSGTGIIQNYSLPTATINGNESICDGTSTTFNVSFTGVSPWDLSYKINNGNEFHINNITQNPYALSASTAGNYTISAVSDGNCSGSGSGSAVLTIIPAPSLQINLADTIFSRTTIAVPITFSPAGGSYLESDKPNAIQPYLGVLSFWPIIADTAGSPHWIRYKYTDPGTTCVGKDSLRVFVVANSGDIQIDHPKAMYCFNDDTIEIFGLNIRHTTGYFTIEGNTGLIDKGNNRALLLPSVIQSGTRIVSYHYTDIAEQVVSKSFSFESITSNFRWDNECFGNSSSVGFYDMSAITPTNHTLTNHIWNFTFNDTIITHDSVYSKVRFSSLGNYPVKYTVISQFGCKDSVTKYLNLKPTIDVFESPYNASFSAGTSSWSAQSIVPGTNNTWTFGVPTGQIFHALASQKGWYTNVINVLQSEESYVTSPCFDFSNSERPMIKMDLWRAFTPNLDGAVLQYSIDKGVNWFDVGDINDGINWYNSYNIQGSPGNQGIGWTNVKDDNWITSKHSLDNLIGQSVVIFRVAYGASPGVNIERNGIAFRNVWIGERSKKVLMEYFTNETDPTSRNTDSEFNTLVNRNASDIIDIQYHLDFGSDTFYKLNPLPFDTRESYYNISEVPYAILDGGRGSDPQYMFDFQLKKPEQKDLTLAMLSDNLFDINMTAAKAGNSINIDAGIKAVSALSNRTITLHIAVIERLIKITGTNNVVSNFESVLRDEVPDVTGTSYTKAWTAGSSEIVHFNWVLKDIFDPTEIRIVAYLQDEATKEIYQSAIVNPSGYTPIEIPEQNESAKFLIYPNPAQDRVFVELHESLPKKTIIQFIDQTGRIIYSTIMASGNHLAEIKLSGIKAGVYVVKLTDKYNLIGTKKLVVLQNKN